MESPEGRGIAAASLGCVCVGGEGVPPAVQGLSRKLALPRFRLIWMGFWLVWHLEGGFEGLRGLGMSRASIYRRIKLFRIATA